MKEKIYARARKVPWHGIGDFVCISGSGRVEVCGSHEKLSGGEGKEGRKMRFLIAPGPSKLDFG